MTENETSTMHDPQWHISVQYRAPEETSASWEQCCIGERLGGSAVEVGREFLRTHPDNPVRVHRILLWANENRTGVVWTITQDTAHRFNPYTGEHADLLQLPLLAQPDVDADASNPITTPVEVAERGERDAQTAAGLRWAEAVSKVSWETIDGPVGAQANPPYVGTFADFLRVNPGFVKDPHAPNAPDTTSTHQASMVLAARVLDEAINAAIGYAATHRDGERWSNVEECLAPVAAAASTFTAAYMLWLLSS